jgi:Carboxypeptidase regulatory-like domain
MQQLSYYRSVEATTMQLTDVVHHNCRVGKRLGPGVLALALAVTAAYAQSQFVAPPKTAAINGTIADQTGASISEATVTLKSAEGFTLQTKADQNGRFAMDAWPGEYTLNISAQGFRPLSEPISLSTTTNLTKHVVLPISGSCTPCVTIESPAIQLEIPSYLLAATLPPKPLPPLKLHPRGLKNRAQ